MSTATSSLHNKRIAIPESRQLLLLSQMLEKRGAQVIPVPLVAIHDAPDPEPVLRWLDEFCAQVPDILILLTGEGLRRLYKLAEKHGRQDQFITALAVTRKLCRGPKPNKALREIGLERDLDALAPTTDGVIASLENLHVDGLDVAVQLYGTDPNRKLIDYLQDRGARVRSVAPYVYADQAEELKVCQLIRDLAEAKIDVIAFTSQPQVKRLFQVAGKVGLQEELAQGLSRTAVAAVGPVVAEILREKGVATDIMPQRTYFMKPMVNAIARYLQKH